MPSTVTDKREKMANQLVMRGHATVRELLTAAFGEWPPKGLDIDGNAFGHDHVVDLWITANDRIFGQTVSSRFDAHHEILIGENLEGMSVYSTIGHETVHVMQDYTAHYVPATAGRHGIAAFVRRFASALFDRPACDAMMEKLTHSRAGRISALFNDFCSALPSTERKLAAVRNMEYLRQGIEVQARIQQAIIAGYPQWGRAPATPDEFYAAMKGAGARLSEEIENRLSALPPQSAARDFLIPLEMPLDAQTAVKEINKVVRSFETEGQDIFWRKTMPALYADLIEMCGDKTARARFGLTSGAPATAPAQRRPQA